MAGIFLEWFVDATLKRLAAWKSKRVLARNVAGFVAAFVLVLAAPLWPTTLSGTGNRKKSSGGERPSLEPHPVFGWRLKPSETTRLRWPDTTTRCRRTL